LASLVVSAVLSLSTLAPQASELPKPSGPAAIGTRILHVIDPVRADAAHPEKKREIVVQLWYPASASPGAATTPYAPDPGLVEAMKTAGYYEQDAALLDSWKRVATHAMLDAPAAAGAPLPVLVLSHGAALSRINYTALAEDLASHGWAVVAIDHPYCGLSVLPDGRTTSIDRDPKFEDTEDGWERLDLDCAKDVTVVLDELAQMASNRSTGDVARRLDLKRVGMLGHSLGGTAALVAANRDDRIVACVNMDGGPSKVSTADGVKRPTLVLLSSPIYSDEELAKKGRTKEGAEKAGKERQETWDRVFAVQKQPFWVARVRGTGHMSFTDAPFVMPTTITRFGGRILEPTRTIEIVGTAVRAFFDQEIRGVKSDLLSGASAGFPELEIRRGGK
jgi:pimeloyl-ACP methyl ester carboxylesterase